MSDSFTSFTTSANPASQKTVGSAKQQFATATPKTDEPKQKKAPTAIEKLQAETGLTRDELIDRAVVATLTQRWVPDGEALYPATG